MAAKELTTENFNNIVENGDIVLVDFWAPWCGPCRSFKPIFEKAAETHTDITFAACNTEEQQELAASFNIRSIPTLMVFRERVLLYAEPGALPASALEDLISQIRQLDMSAIHKKVAEQNTERETATA